MAIVTGYLCLVFLLLLLLKFVTKRLKWEKADRLLMRMHKFVALGFLITAIVHFILAMRVAAGRSNVVLISGDIILVAGVLLIIFCHVLRNRRLEIKLHRIFALVMAIMLMVHVGSYFDDFLNYKERIAAIDIEEVDLSRISDGAYVGEYDAGYVYAKVKVTVLNHRIESVEILKHTNERGTPAEVIVDNMVKEQRIDVDSVSGATNSSKVIKKACENALEGK